MLLQVDSEHQKYHFPFHKVPILSKSFKNFLLEKESSKNANTFLIIIGSISNRFNGARFIDINQFWQKEISEILGRSGEIFQAVNLSKETTIIYLGGRDDDVWSPDPDFIYVSP